MRPSPPGAPPRFEILGPLRVWRGDDELDPGSPRQAGLLALLLAREGRPISARRLVELIWDTEPPPTAVNVVQQYVGRLRRLIEPDLPPRAGGSFLVRRGDAYLIQAGPAQLDLAAFRQLTAAARANLQELRRPAALDCYAAAVDLWRGPAGGGLIQAADGRALFADLDRAFVDACVTATELAISLGAPERVRRPMRLAAAMAPLDEPVQAAMIELLGAAGEQAEALNLFSAVRSRLAAELEIQPGPALQRVHQRLIGPEDAPRPAAPEAPSPGGLVGRAAELAVLREATESALAGGTGLVLVEGEPGVGKTRLLEEIAAEADRDGMSVVWGRCLAGDGTPSMWPWVQVVSALLDALPDPANSDQLVANLGPLVESRIDLPRGPAIPDDGTQFRLFEQVVAVIGHAAAQRPTLVVLDDLHWADVASLRLFSHLAERLPDATAVVGALRNRAPVPGSELSRALAGASRVSGHRRITLLPLDLAGVADLIQQETGAALGFDAARSVHARTGGNPFFVRELSRLLAGNGEDAGDQPDVPSTVRDVVLDRIAGLDPVARNLLDTAAIIGRDVRLGVLAPATGLDLPDCLDRLAPLEELGLIGPSPGDPYSVRFIHDLVREAVAGSVPPSRLPGMHLRIADALERVEAPGRAPVEQLAHHLWAAGPLADPARTAAALVRAGRRAADKSAFEAAEQHLERAVQLARSAGLPELELAALSALSVVSRRRVGDVGSTVQLLDRAAYLAHSLGREAEAADFSCARAVAANHTLQPERVSLARHLLDQGAESADPVVRAYGLQVWAQHLTYDLGEIGEARRYLSQGELSMEVRIPVREQDPLRYDMYLYWRLSHAMVLGLNGDVAAARRRFDDLAEDAGNEPYELSVCAHFAAMTAVAAGDAGWALRVTGPWSEPGPGHYFLHLDYLRLEWLWARAMTGDDPLATAAEAEKIVVAALLDPPRWGAAFYYGLIGEMLLTAGRVEEAGAALDRADELLADRGPRNVEGLLLLLRARLFQARGEQDAVVRAAAQHAREVSTERGAHVFAKRAERFLAGL